MIAPTMNSSIMLLMALGMFLPGCVGHDMMVIKPRALIERSGAWRLASESAIIVRGGSDNYNNDPYRRKDPYDYENSRKGAYNDEYGDSVYQDGNENQSRPSYYDDDGYYDDRGSKSNEAIADVSKLMKHGDRRIGLVLLGSGSVFTMLGISLFFNKSLMRLGNLLFIAGVPMLIGPGRTAGYFFQPKKARATACLAVGIFLVFIGSPVFGIILEIFGLLNLFGNMFPLVTMMVKQMPVVGPLFRGGQGGNRRRRDDDYDDERRDYDDLYRREDDRYRYEDRYRKSGVDDDNDGKDYGDDDRDRYGGGSGGYY